MLDFADKSATEGSTDLHDHKCDECDKVIKANCEENCSEEEEYCEDCKEKLAEEVDENLEE